MINKINITAQVQSISLMQDYKRRLFILIMTDFLSAPPLHEF